MNQSIFLFVIISIVVVAVIIISFFFSKKARVKRKLKSAVVKRIVDFRDGETAKIVGKVEFVDAPLKSPLSGRECSLYYVLVEQKVSNGKSSHWKKLIEEEVSNKFVIREDNYCAYIDNTKLKSYIVQDKRYRSGFMEDATEILEKYLNDHGYKSEGLFGMNKTIRYREGVLEKGEEVAVLGKGEWKTGTQLGLPDYYDRVLAFSSNDGEYVYMSDDPDIVQKKFKEQLRYKKSY